jgi:hypothetical protein
MDTLTEKQKILLNNLFDIIAHNDIILEDLAHETGVEVEELSELVNTVEF